MTEPASPAAGPAGPPDDRSDLALIRFFEQSPAARTAASSLGKAAEVGVSFTDVPGQFHFRPEGGKPRLAPGPPKDADFDLTLGPLAVQAICQNPKADIGDLGIIFFQHILAKEPERKIRVKLHSGLMKLTLRGWLGVLAHGGPKVLGWMATKGLKGPGAVAEALSRLRK